MLQILHLLYICPKNGIETWNTNQSHKSFVFDHFKMLKIQLVSDDDNGNDSITILLYRSTQK